MDKETESYIKSCQAMIRDNNNYITELQIELGEIKQRLKALEGKDE